MSNALTVTTPTDREIVVTRTFDAPRKQVWAALTKPEYLKRWLLGPPGWTMTECEDSQTVGGKFRYAWKGPNGEAMAMSGTIREVSPPERIVRTESFDFGCDAQAGEQLATAVLSEQGCKTLLTITLLYSTKEARDASAASGMEHGMAAGYAKMEELLAAVPAGTRTRAAGEFCWLNMLTPKPAEARAFFGPLLGWEFFEMPGVGHGVRVGGRDVGGLFDLHGPNTPPGTPAHIGVMVKVDSADRTAARVAELGGKALPPFDVFDAGRMAVCFDPNGAAFDLWEPRKMHGTDVDPALPGAPCWFETLTTDTARAAAFYSALFGWTATVKPSSIPGAAYTEFALGDRPVGGMMPVTPEMGEFPPHWAVYFTVTDTDATVKRAVELGGSVCVPPMDIPNVGRLAGLTSPHGVSFNVITVLG